MSRKSCVSLLIVLLIGGLSSSAAAQSVLVTRGLGFPVEPLDGRARGLGGIGIGLSDGEISWASPAGLYGMPAPGMVVAYQYDDFNATAGNSEYTSSTARFPFLLGAFPAGRTVFFAGFGGFLDQNWRVETADTIDFAGRDEPILDISTSSGGVARMRAGATYSPADGLGIALGVDVFTGSVERVQGRVLRSEATAPTCCRSEWNYKGVGYMGGVHWAPTPATGLALSLSYGGTLTAEPQITEAEEREYELPLLVRLGASGRIGQNTLLALAGSWDGWSSLDDALAEQGGTRDAWSLHAGLEWDGMSIRERNIPVRIGARTGALPFAWEGTAGEGEPKWAGERAVTGGFGVVLGGGAVRPDFAFELGSRGGGDSGLDESFWRFGFSVRVVGR